MEFHAMTASEYAKNAVVALQQVLPMAHVSKTRF
jgi:hypothetical protein